MGICRSAAVVLALREVTALQDALSAHLLRRDKASVEHSLPPRQEVFVPVKLTRVQRQWYRALL